jgi:hypothetical protein
VAKHRFPQFKAERDDPLFSPFAVEDHKQIVKVNFPDSKVEGFADSASCIEQEEHKQMQAAIVFSLRFPRDQSFNLRIGESGASLNAALSTVGLLGLNPTISSKH